MNKKELLKKLEEYNLDKDEYMLLAGASMVLRGLKKETFDIDIAVSSDYYDYLLNNYECEFEVVNNSGCKIYQIDNLLSFGTDHFNEDKDYILDFPCQRLEDILVLKKGLNRKKDQADIKKIELAMALKDTYQYERNLINEGYELIAGVDEVGRGPLVGPVVAAAVILPKNYKLEGLTDSKKLSEEKRNHFCEIIKKDAISYGIGVIDNEKIDEVNIYEATKLAMIDAINKLDIKPDYVLTDAMKLDLDIPTLPIIKGDLKSLTISAASVIAKVYRDNLMYELDKKYPFYNFKNNKGYPTKDHLKAIEEHGIIKEHRRSYGPVKKVVNE